jgi:hypothetical protein
VSCAAAGALPWKGDVPNVQYTTMVALIKEAEHAGEEETAFVNDSLFEAFDIWLSRQHLDALSRDEQDALHRTFEKGFGICVHNQA